MCDPGKQRQAWATCPRASPSISQLSCQLPAAPQPPHTHTHQLCLGGYSCFSSQQGSCAALHQPLSSTFTCQRDFIPLCRGSEGHGGNDHQHREAGTKQLKAASAGLQLPSFSGADASQAPPPRSQFGVAHPAVAPTTHPRQPRLAHSRRELLRADAPQSSPSRFAQAV